MSADCFQAFSKELGVIGSVKRYSAAMIQGNLMRHSRPVVRGSSLPLDPPPFFLNGEIKLPATRCVVDFLTGAVPILLFMALIFRGSNRSPVSLAMLFVPAVGVLAGYLVMRTASYWTVWLWTSGQYPANGGIHPTARGELPRNAYIVVLVAPAALWVPMCGLISYLASGLGPETWLVFGTGAGIALTDARIAHEVWSLDRDSWVMETKSGLDVLTPDALRVTPPPPRGVSRSSSSVPGQESQPDPRHWKSVPKTAGS